MKILKTRAKTHGDYTETAEIAQALKSVMHRSDNWGHLPAHMKESLDLHATKIARILNGNPYEPDHWQDIAGYATLVSETLK